MIDTQALPLSGRTFLATGKNSATIMILAATAGQQAARRRDILRLLNQLKTELAGPIGCSSVSPILVDRNYRWIITGQIARDERFPASIGLLFGLGTLKTLRSLAAVDCYVLQELHEPHGDISVRPQFAKAPTFSPQRPMSAPI